MPALDDAQREIVRREVEGPDFVKTFESALTEQQAVESKLEEGIKAGEKLAAVSPQTQLEAMLDDRGGRAAQVLADLAKFQSEGGDVDALSRVALEGLRAKADFDQRREDGKVVSERAIKQHEEWQLREAMATLAQHELTKKLSDVSEQLNQPVGTQLSEKSAVIEGVESDAGQVGKLQDYADRSLKRLARLSESVLSADGRDVDEIIQEHAEMQAGQRVGIEVATTPEQELLTREIIEQRVSEILEQSKIKADYADGAHAAELKRQLGIVEEHNESGEVVDIHLTENSPLRASILAKDAAEAANKAFQANLEQAQQDPDYAEAAFHTANVQVQAESYIVMADAAIQELSTVQFAKQQEAIAKEIGNLERQQKLNGFISENSEKVMQKVKRASLALRRGIRAISRRAQEYVSNTTKLDARNASLVENEARLAELKDLLENE